MDGLCKLCSGTIEAWCGGFFLEGGGQTYPTANKKVVGAVPSKFISFFSNSRKKILFWFYMCLVLSIILFTYLKKMSIGLFLIILSPKTMHYACAKHIFPVVGVGGSKGFFFRIWSKAFFSVTLLCQFNRLIMVIINNEFAYG